MFSVFAIWEVQLVLKSSLCEFMGSFTGQFRICQKHCLYAVQISEFGGYTLQLEERIKNVLTDLCVPWVERTLKYWTGVIQSQRERVEPAG